MRNRKDSVGAKAAAWVGITLGAVVFFTGAAGVKAHHFWRENETFVVTSGAMENQVDHIAVDENPLSLVERHFCV